MAKKLKKDKEQEVQIVSQAEQFTPAIEPKEDLGEFVYKYSKDSSKDKKLSDMSSKEIEDCIKFRKNNAIRHRNFMDKNIEIAEILTQYLEVLV